MNNNARVLVLNRSYEAHQVLKLKQALKLITKNRADILKTVKDNKINSRYESIPMPSVILLNNYVNIPHKPAPYSKKNILIRDLFTCQYCGSKSAPLTVDHIIPQSKGGLSNWTNCVACCKRCNTIKGDLSLAKSGFTLNKKPRQPTHFALFRYLNTYPEWSEFLYL